MPRVTLNTLTSYKVNKNLTVEAREENGKNTLFVNGKVYVFDKIEEGNFFFSKEEKNIRNILVDNIENINVSFYLNGKRPLLIRCDFNANVDNGLGCIINKLYTFYLDQYDIETFAGLPTQKGIERLSKEYCSYLANYNEIHGSFVDICCRAAGIYISKKIDVSLYDIPAILNAKPKGTYIIKKQDKYIKDILSKATNDLEKQLFNITIRIVLLTQIHLEKETFKSLELARDEFFKNELAKGESIETLFTNLIADMQDFANKALKSEQFKHLKYRDIQKFFCNRINDGSVEFYDTFKAEDLCSEPDLLFKSIDRYLDNIRHIQCKVENIIDNHIKSKISVEKCRDIINNNVNRLQAMFRGIQYLIDIGCKLNNQSNECLRRITNRLQSAYEVKDNQECLCCDSKLVFVECNVEPFKIVEHYAINAKVKKGERTDINKKFTLHLLEFLLKEKVINPDDGEEVPYCKTNDIRMAFMRTTASSDITEHTMQFFTILDKYGFNLKQEHLDALQNTIATASKVVIENKDEVSKYIHLTCLELSRQPQDITAMCYEYTRNVAYLKNASPFLEFVKNNVR